MIANFAAMPVKPGSMGRPLPGITAAVVHREADGHVAEVTEPGVEGELALVPGWPSELRPPALAGVVGVSGVPPTHAHLSARRAGCSAGLRRDEATDRSIRVRLQALGRSRAERKRPPLARGDVPQRIGWAHLAVLIAAAKGSRSGWR
jgi:hypothetical protein